MGSKSSKRKKARSPSPDTSSSSSSSSSDSQAARRAAARKAAKAAKPSRKRSAAAAALGAAADAPNGAQAAKAPRRAPPQPPGAAAASSPPPDASGLPAKVRKILRKLDSTCDVGTADRLQRMLARAVAATQAAGLAHLLPPAQQAQAAAAAAPPPPKPAIQFSLASGRKRTPAGGATVAQLALTPLELARRAERAQRFADDLDGEGGGGPAAADVPLARLSRKARARLAGSMGGSGGGGSGGFSLVGASVFGTSLALEKEYLRLTSAPRAEDVRPPRVLQQVGGTGGPREGGARVGTTQGWAAVGGRRAQGWGGVSAAAAQMHCHTWWSGVDGVASPPLRVGARRPWRTSRPAGPMAAATSGPGASSRRCVKTSRCR